MGRDGALLLLVDDDQPTAEVIQELLEQSGFRVETAANGQVALDRVAHDPLPDLAIVDLMMPEMDGWTLVSRLREDRRTSRMPIVIVSAFGEPALMRAPAAEAHLSKPISAELLVETIRSALARRSAPSKPRRHLERSATPIESTGPYPVLHLAAEQTASDLAALDTHEAATLRQDLLAMSAEVRRWSPSSPPQPDHRTRVTDELIDKMSKAFSLLGGSETEK